MVGRLFFFLNTYYSGFMGKVSTLTYFPLEQGCKDYSFLDKAIADFEPGLYSILNDVIKTLELDASFDEPGTVTSQFLQCSYAWLLPFLIILNNRLLLASNLVNNGTRLRCCFYLYYWQPKCQPQKLIHYSF